MSALAVPFVFSTAVQSGASDMVNVEQVSAITRVTAEGQKNVYQIVFHLQNNGVGTPNWITWSYDRSPDRDADYDGLLAQIAAAVVPVT